MDASKTSEITDERLREVALEINYYIETGRDDEAVKELRKLIEGLPTAD